MGSLHVGHWRVVTISSWGLNVLLQTMRGRKAKRYFLDYKWDTPAPFNIDLQLQRLTKAGWLVVARRNSSAGPGHP